MIKVTYKPKTKKDEIYYDADDFQICSGVPFTRDGLYLKKGGKVVAYISNLFAIEKVEKVEVTQ